MSTRGKVARGKPAYDDATEIYGRSAHPSGLRPEDDSDFSKRKRSAAISNGGCDGRRSFGRSTRAHSELLAA